MDIDTRGQWVQVHEPSGLRIPLGFPFQDDFTLQDSGIKHTFDLRERLTAKSPGVVPKTNPVLLYRLPEELRTP